MKLRPWRVVLVDDDVDCREVIAQLVQHIFGPAALVHCAADGEEAYALLAGCTTDLLLSDFNMPRLNGGDLAMRLAAEGRLATLPMLILTGGAEAARDQALRQAGVASILAKPFSTDELRRSVLEVLGLDQASPLPSSPEALPQR